MAGQGARLRSVWHEMDLLRAVVQYADSDTSERTIWADWWFEAAAGAPVIAPPSGLRIVQRGRAVRGVFDNL